MYTVSFKTTGPKFTFGSKEEAVTKAVSMSTKSRTVFVRDDSNQVIFAVKDKKYLNDKVIWKQTRNGFYKYVVADKNGNMKMIRYHRQKKPIIAQNEVKFMSYSDRESITFKVSKTGMPYGIRVAGKKISTLHDESVIIEWNLIPNEVKMQFAKEYVDKFEDAITAMDYQAQIDRFELQPPEHIKSYAKYSRIKFGDQVLQNIVKNVGYNAFNPERKLMYKVCKVDMPQADYALVTLRVLPDTKMLCYDKKCFKIRGDRFKVQKIELINENDKVIGLTRSAYSAFEIRFKYNVGETVQADLDESEEVCTKGIHCFMTKKEAMNYRHGYTEHVPYIAKHEF